MTLLPGGRDQQISEEMIDEIHRRWRHWATAPSRTMIRDALAAVLPLLPDEAAIRADERAKIADDLHARAAAVEVFTPNGAGYRNGLRSAAFIAALPLRPRHAARGSATEETR